MKSTIQIAKILGISINLHLTFFILPILASIVAGFKGVFLVLFIFLCVTLHELSHSLAALYFGIRVKNITLYPIGGIATMDTMPNRPRDELIISIAGPSSNFVIAAILYLVLQNILPPAALYNISGRITNWQEVFGATIWINVMLGLFNLLPAFPMDGGRIFRAFLAQFMDYRRATRIAVIASNIFSGFFVIISLWIGHIMLGIIAVFLFMAANQEQVQVDIRTTLKGYRVKNILGSQFLTVQLQTLVSDMLNMIFHSHQEDFPVVSNNNTLVGFVPRLKIMSAIHSGHTNKTAEDIMEPLSRLPVIGPEDTLVDAYRIMQTSGFKALPVLSENHPIGLITLENIEKILPYA
jgi:Zn-dependent protease/CBS domain-containing protein